MKLCSVIKGANKITQATPPYFKIAFVIAFEEIFLKYSWNSLEFFSKNLLKF
jgi:hypothetical protein